MREWGGDRGRGREIGTHNRKARGSPFISSTGPGAKVFQCGDSTHFTQDQKAASLPALD